MAKKVVILFLLIIITAFAARALIYPAVTANTAVSPTIQQGETMLITRFEHFTNQPFNRFEVVAIIPPFLQGRAYEPVETPLSIFADLTGIPVSPVPAIELQRVIALPNETVVIRQGLGIFIDGKLLDESTYTKDLPHSDLFVLADIVRESMENGVLQSYESSEAPIVVPPDMVFVMPDDRKNFSGSNEWGFLPQKRIVGKVSFKLAKNGIESIKTPAVKFATQKVAINDDGVRALDKGEYTKAIHLFKSALAIDNNFDLAQDNLSIAYNNFAIQSAGKPEVALDSLHKALFLDPDNDLTKKNLAGILKRMGKDATKFEDRVELAEDALKHKKTISALVEYRAAVKLQPTPTILAKVSALEAQCNFPPHAIPEDLVTATIDNTALLNDKSEPIANSSEASDTRLELGERTQSTDKRLKKAAKAESTGDPSYQNKSLKLAKEKQEKVIAEKESTKKETSKNRVASKSKSGSKKTPDSEHSQDLREEPDSTEVADSEETTVSKETASARDKIEKKQKKASKDEIASSKKANTKDKVSSADQPDELLKAKTAPNEKTTTKKTTADKLTAKKMDSGTGSTKKSSAKQVTAPTSEAKKIASSDIENSPTDSVSVQTQLKPKSSNGFDLGSFMQNLVSSFSVKNPPSEVEVTPEGYRGPPRLKKGSE